MSDRYVNKLPDEPDYRPDRTSGLVYGRCSDRLVLALMVPGHGAVFLSTRNLQLSLSIMEQTEEQA